VKVQQVVQSLAPARLVIHGEQVFFNTWDEEEAAHWAAEGARLREFYPPSELKRLKTVNQGWEVQLKWACEPVLVHHLNGEVEDVTATTLANEARRRRQEAGL
jgi:hypothetical protein